MARPKEFDRAEALSAAIRLFADRGYEGTSTDALLSAMGLGRQSLYDTFGSKRHLYLLALRSYSDRSVAQILDDLALGSTPIDGLEQVLLGFIERACAQTDRTCLGVSAMWEFGLRDDDILAAGRESQLHLRLALTNAVKAAVEQHEIRDTIDPETVVNFYLAVLAGLKTSARGGLPKDALERMARLAVEGLR